MYRARLHQQASFHFPAELLERMNKQASGQMLRQTEESTRYQSMRGTFLDENVERYSP